MASPPLGVGTRLAGVPGQEGRHTPIASLAPAGPTRVVTEGEALSYMYLSTVSSHQVTSLPLPSPWMQVTSFILELAISPQQQAYPWLTTLVLRFFTSAFWGWSSGTDLELQSGKERRCLICSYLSWSPGFAARPGFLGPG